MFCVERNTLISLICCLIFAWTLDALAMIYSVLFNRSRPVSTVVLWVFGFLKSAKPQTLV